MAAARPGRRKSSAPSPEGAPAPEPEETDDESEETEEEPEETEEETPASPGGPPSFRPFSGSDNAQNGAGILLSVLVYCVAVNYLKGGVPQVRQWFSAKFFNKTSSTPAGGTTKAPAPTQPSSPTKAPPGMGVL